MNWLAKGKMSLWHWFENWIIQGRLEYQLSARPDFHQILQDNNVRVSLFSPNGNTSELPEFKDTAEEWFSHDECRRDNGSECWMAVF